MARAAVTVLNNKAPPDELFETELVIELVIVGGGICGILAAKQCSERQWPYVVIDLNEELGGVWSTLANRHSYLQAYEPSYRWDVNYRLNKNEFSKNSGIAVHQGLKKYAYDNAIDRFTRFNTEVLTIHHQPNGSFLTVCKHMKTGKIVHIKSAFIIVTSGILRQQYTAAEHGVKDIEKFRGIFTYGGRMNGEDSAVGATDLTGKRVVIMGTGAFALEAVEAADRNNAEHITLVSRPRKRWVLPFSRQFFLSFFAYLPLVPWPIKIYIASWYMRTRFYKPAGLSHVPPVGRLDEQDWGGQCNDGLFRVAYEKRLDVVIDTVSRLEDKYAVLERTGKIKADMFVCAAGCHYNHSPQFLSDLGVGFNDLHNFCFMGNNPRVGTASDFVFAFVPLGPQKQLEMYFHAVEQIKAGNEQAVIQAMFPTPLSPDGKFISTHMGGRMASPHTWYAYRHWYSTSSINMEDRLNAYFSIMDVGASISRRIAMRVWVNVEAYVTAAYFMWKGIQELLHYPIFGKGIKDHFHPNPAIICPQEKLLT